MARDPFKITRAINCGAKYSVDSREFCGRGCREDYTSFSVNGKEKTRAFEFIIFY